MYIHFMINIYIYKILDSKILSKKKDAFNQSINTYVISNISNKQKLAYAIVQLYGNLQFLTHTSYFKQSC